MVTHSEWQERLRADLGGDAVDVELVLSNYTNSIRRAIQLWNRYRPHLQWLDLGTFMAGTSVWALTEDTVGVAGVLDMMLADTPQGPLAPMVSLTTLQLRWGRRGARIFFSRLTDMRRMERFSGTQPDWWWDPGENLLYIYNPSRPVYAMALIAAQRQQNGEDIRYDEESMFEDLALGYTKITAADILEQAGEVPGPQGAAIGSNAAVWRERGEAMVEKVETELKNSLKSAPPPRWIG